MKFKTNHSPGPFSIQEAPAMLEYVMDRAEFLSRFTHIAVYAWGRKRILAILKDAGAEVF